MKTVKYIAENYLCSACGACVAICAKHAISFHKSALGRVYPRIDQNCVECGLCMKACPSFTTNKKYSDYFNLKKRQVAVGHANNTSYHLNGQSGGAVTAVLSFLFDSHKIDAALVCKPDVNGNGLPYVATNKEQLLLCQKSSYTPVSLLVAIDSIMSYTSVAVVGLPCHISGLENLMKIKKIPVSYKLGLICDRTLCGTISLGIRRYLKVKDGDDVIIKWRDKSITDYTYYNAPISVELPNGNLCVIPGEVRQKLKNRFTAPRCLVCPDKLNISADIVFGDPWNISVNTDCGESLIIANTPLGEKILQKAVDNHSILLKKVNEMLLDKSQHVSERMHQTFIYSRFLRKHGNTSLYLLDSPEVKTKVAVMEYIRAFFNLFRFYFLEFLTERLVAKYAAMIILRKITSDSKKLHY